MSANFYNSSGSMFGLDLHDYLGMVPPEVLVPIPGKAFYGVAADFDGSCDDESTRLKTVTTNGKPTLQGGFARKFIVHVPIVPVPSMLPHPLELGLCGLLLSFSSSTAILKKATVTGGGKPLAICVHGAWGINLNCGDPVDLPLDVVHNENSVKTEPSAGDFVAAVVEAIVNAIVGALVGKMAEKLIPARFPEAIRNTIEDEVKKLLNDFLNKPAKDKARELLGSLGVTHV